MFARRDKTSAPKLLGHYRSRNFRVRNEDTIRWDLPVMAKEESSFCTLLRVVPGARVAAEQIGKAYGLSIIA